MDSQESRICRLERQILILKVILCGILAGLAVLAALATGFDRSVVRAQRIELQDLDGTTRLLLSGNPRSGISLLGITGSTRASVNLDAEDRPGIFLHADNADIGIAFNNMDLPAMEMRRKGLPQLTLGLIGNGAGLAFHGPDGTPKLTLQCASPVNTIDFGGPLRLQTDDVSAAIQLSSSGGTIRLSTPADAAPGIQTTATAKSPQ